MSTHVCARARNAHAVTHTSTRVTGSGFLLRPPLLPPAEFCLRNWVKNCRSLNCPSARRASGTGLPFVPPLSAVSPPACACRHRPRSPQGPLGPSSPARLGEGGGQRSGPRRSSASASSSPSRLSRKEAGGERSCFAPGRAGEQLWRRWLPAAVQPGTQPPAGGAFAISPRVNGKTGAKPGAGTHPDPPYSLLPPATRSHPRAAGMLAQRRRGHLVLPAQETGAGALLCDGCRLVSFAEQPRLGAGSRFRRRSGCCALFAVNYLRRLISTSV